MIDATGFVAVSLRTKRGTHLQDVSNDCSSMSLEHCRSFSTTATAAAADDGDEDEVAADARDVGGSSVVSMLTLQTT